jgi:hypothetical protein
MTLYELLFILLFLASAIALITVLIMTLTRHRQSAKRLLLSTLTVWGVYLAVLFVSDALEQQQVVKAGDNTCFDEMCFAVVSTQQSGETATSSSLPPSSGGKLYAVTVRMTSQSRGRAQAEGGLRGRLYQDGKYFTVSDADQHAFESLHGPSPKLTQRLDPGQSILSVLVFEVPGEITHPALTLDHGFTPGYFVIGESPFFHKPPHHGTALAAHSISRFTASDARARVTAADRPA